MSTKLFEGMDRTLDAPQTIFVAVSTSRGSDSSESINIGRPIVKLDLSVSVEIAMDGTEFYCNSYVLAYHKNKAISWKV